MRKLGTFYIYGKYKTYPIFQFIPMYMIKKLFQRLYQHQLSKKKLSILKQINQLNDKNESQQQVSSINLKTQILLFPNNSSLGYFCLSIMSVFNRNNFVISQLVEQTQKITSYDKIQVPTQSQILSMFQKNGFRANNVVTRDQLKELFDRQYAMNNMDQMGEQSVFSEDLFDELWGHLQLMSDSSAKIQNISQVIHDALQQLQRKLTLINSQQGLESKQLKLDQLIEREKELTQEMDLIDAEYNYHQQKIKAQRNLVRINIGKIKAQINQISLDKSCFEGEMKMLIITIGEHGAPPVETKLIMDGLMSMTGLQRKEKSDGLKFIFIMTIICMVIELFVLSYKNSFVNMVGLCLLLYVLFCGYYTDKSISYLILYFIMSILLDLGFVYLNMFTSLILSPIIYTFNNFLRYVGMICILVSLVGRIALIIKMFSYREIPKHLHYFQFWGQEVVLNRRNKQFISNYASRV